MRCRSFAAMRLEPAARPFDVTGRHFIPDGESFHLRQIALAQPAKSGVHASVSMRTKKVPMEMVLCTLRAGCEQVMLSLELTQEHEAIFSVAGAPVDMCGYFELNGEPYNDWANSVDEGEGDEENDSAGSDMVAHSTIKTIGTAEAFQALLADAAAAGKTVFVDFTASWCGPCKAIAPLFKALAKSTPSAIFAKVDVDENEEVAAECRITAMPTFKAFQGAKQVAELKGADEAALRKMVQKVAASAPVPRAALPQEQVAAVGSKRALLTTSTRREAADSLRGQRAQVARVEEEEEEDDDDDDEGDDDDGAAEEEEEEEDDDEEEEDEDDHEEQDTAAEQTRARPAHGPAHGTAPVHAVASATTLSDMHLSCKDCRQPFIFTVVEQQTFLHYGYAIPRIRCKPCSEAKKLGNYNKTGGFFKSETGKGAAGPQPAATSRHDGHIGGIGSGKGKGGSVDRGFGGRAGGEGSIRAGGNGADGAGGRDKGGGGKGGVGKSAPPGGGTSFDTRKCFAFQQGTCNRGAACKFMHA